MGWGEGDFIVHCEAHTMLSDQLICVCAAKLEKIRGWRFWGWGKGEGGFCLTTEVINKLMWLNWQVIALQGFPPRAMFALSPTPQDPTIWPCGK